MVWENFFLIRWDSLLQNLHESDQGKRWEEPHLRPCHRNSFNFFNTCTLQLCPCARVSGVANHRRPVEGGLSFSYREKVCRKAGCAGADERCVECHSQDWSLLDGFYQTFLPGSIT